jgi:hypothetical protein
LADGGGDDPAAVGHVLVDTPAGLDVASEREDA